MTKTTRLACAIALVVATGCGGGGSGNDFDAPHIDQCPTTGRYLELATGMSWTYKVTNNGNVDTKTQSVGALEDAGGAKAGVMAFRLTTGKPGGDTTVSWQQDVNNTIIRQRELDHYMTPQQIDTSFDPSKLRADDTPAHTMAGATWNESYTENVVGGSPTAKTEVWTVVAVDEPVMVPAGAFCTLHLHKASSVGGSSSSDKDYWFARGVGKIKEAGAGANPQTEELSAYSR